MPYNHHDVNISSTIFSQKVLTNIGMTIMCFFKYYDYIVDTLRRNAVNIHIQNSVCVFVCEYNFPYTITRVKELDRPI